jgi:hypothetical protein
MSPTKPANAMLNAVSQGTAAGYKVVFINGTTACGDSLSGCSDGCASHPGKFVCGVCVCVCVCVV